MATPTYKSPTVDSDELINSLLQTSPNWGSTPSMVSNPASSPSSTVRTTAGGEPSTPTFSQRFFGDTLADGTQVQSGLSAGLNTFTGLANAYLGWQQFNLAKDQLSQNKKIFNLNFENQAKLTNTQLEDRQRARVSRNANEFESVSSYMDKNAVRTTGI